MVDLTVDQKARMKVAQLAVPKGFQMAGLKADLLVVLKVDWMVVQWAD